MRVSMDLNVFNLLDHDCWSITMILFLLMGIREKLVVVMSDDSDSVLQGLKDG